jgi:hypothetical protein
MIGHPARKGPVTIESVVNAWREGSILVVPPVVEVVETGGGRNIENVRGMSKWRLLSGEVRRRPQRAGMKMEGTNDHGVALPCSLVLVV